MVGKAEYLEKGENPRFVVTSLSSEEFDSKTLYEDQYCARGDMENRIKEQQLCLFADRTSAATMRANQLRLWFSSVAYYLNECIETIGTKGYETGQGTMRYHSFEVTEDRRSDQGDSSQSMGLSVRELSVSANFYAGV